MKPEDWQAYQAGRSSSPSTSYNQHANSMHRQPIKNSKRVIGWPMAFLLFSLAILASCVYSMNSMMDGMSASSFAKVTREPSIGVLVINEEIMGSMWATETIAKFQEDPQIKALVLRINSPGGSVAPCQEIYNALKNFNKPIVVSMGSVAASGGLYIASAGNTIMANPGTITGSIGVIMQSVEVSGTMDKLGLKSQVIKSGNFKDMGSPFREMRADERELLQKMVNNVYEQFVADLSAGRPKMDKDILRNLADGRIYTGEEAAKLGLVDQLGGFEEAIYHAAKKAGLPTNKRPKLVVEDGRNPWWQAVLKGEAQPAISLPPSLTPGFSLKYLYQPGIGSSAD